MKRFYRLPELFSENHWDRIRLDETCCFVCGKAFKKSKQKIISIGTKDGVRLLRHERCNSNSTKWKKKFKGCTTL